MRGPRSIRLRITLVATLVVAVVLATTAVVLVLVQRSQLIENLDASLTQRADTTEAAIGTGDTAPFATSDDADRFVQLVAPDGTVIAASPNVAGMAAAVPPPAGDRFVTVDRLPIEDDAYRILIRQLDSGELLYVAENVDDVDDAVRNLAASLAAALPLVLVALAALVWWLVGRTLRPVESIRAEVAEIGEGALDRRVPVPPTSDEIAGLARTMNDMLDRVEDASRRQQAFVADASHELRSPLTRMRTAIEVELAHDDADLRATLASALEEVGALQQLVDDLLELARADAGVPAGPPVPLDLDDVVLREARHLRESTELRIDTCGVSGAHLRGDPAQLTRLVRNLCDNAARHATSEVCLGVGEHDGLVRLTVEDDGPGLDGADLERMFERFTRLDESRTAIGGGTGLGLAIVRDIASRHRGTARAEPRPEGGLKLVVELPGS